MRKVVLMVFVVTVAVCCRNQVSYEHHDSYSLAIQTKGPTLGYTSAPLIMVDGLAFKDLDRNGELTPYEDWRLPTSERAADLASRLTTEELCGLMGFTTAVDAMAGEISDFIKVLLREDHYRHLLIRYISSPRIGASWSNSVQAFCESSDWGIPCNDGTDPRTYTNGTANINNFKPEPDGEFDPFGESDISKWPREAGLAATFDMDVIRKHGEVVSTEYRALGITTTLSPQIDLSTEPRWRRFYGTSSECPELSADIARVYCEAYQLTKGSKTGWGINSVNCMPKHWPGGGTGEGGRDAHYGIGKYAVYPGGQFDLGLIPFEKGAFQLNNKTRMASAVMPYYTISWNQDPSGENVGNGFSKYIIQNLLRDNNQFEGVVCTDWGIPRNYKYVYRHIGTPWGMETSTPAERMLKCFEAGVDQIGGVRPRESSIFIDSYRLWEEKYGAESARKRFELSARRILVNIFNVGLFENPYLNPEESEKIVGNKAFVASGYDAQLKSVIMVKNSTGTLPKTDRLKVYEPLRHVPEGFNHWMTKTQPYDEYPISKELLEKYYDVVDTPQDADFAIVSIKSPIGHWGYIMPDDDNPEGHYQPISLQWSPYTASTAREHSIAGGDPTETSSDRSYKGYTETSSNEADMFLVRNTKTAMGTKPVVVIVTTERPFVPADIEPWADAILVAFGVSNHALLDIIRGAAEPYGLLPCQLPANMETVEAQCEDAPYDMECYEDSDGNRYDFAFGLNWKGRITDGRTRKYGRNDAALH